jgi:hypothetical protein
MSDLNLKVMTTENFNILFVQAKNRTNKKNQSPLYCRITLNGIRKQFSTGIHIENVYWNSKRQLVLKTHTTASLYNSLLDNIKSKINNAYGVLNLEDNEFTIEDILDKYQGKEIKKKENILSYYKQYLFKIKKLVGLNLKESTCNKFVYVGNHLEAFLKWKFRKTDFALEELSLQFLDDFDYFLKIEKKQSQITINITIQRCRTPIKQAISEGYIDRDHFTS